MDERLERVILWVSAICVLAAGLIVPLGFLGISATLGVVILMLALAGGLVYARDAIHGYDRYLAWLWVGPAVAAAIAVVGVGIDASPGELQSLGGVVGLVGVFNLLLRPVYELLYYLVTVTRRLGRNRQNDRS